MAALKVPESGLVYVDACVPIYAVEKVRPYCALLAPLWEAVKKQKALIVTSELTLLEVLVKPLREGDAVLQQSFRDALLHAAGVQLVPVALSVLEDAAEVRAATGLRTPDAIHAATAQQARCDSFVTNDPAFGRVSSLHVIVLRDIVSP